MNFVFVFSFRIEDKMRVLEQTDELKMDLTGIMTLQRKLSGKTIFYVRPSDFVVFKRNYGVFIGCDIMDVVLHDQGSVLYLKLFFGSSDRFGGFSDRFGRCSEAKKQRTKIGEIGRFFS